MALFSCQVPLWSSNHAWRAYCYSHDRGDNLEHHSCRHACLLSPIRTTSVRRWPETVRSVHIRGLGQMRIGAKQCIDTEADVRLIAALNRLHHHVVLANRERSGNTGTDGELRFTILNDVRNRVSSQCNAAVRLQNRLRCWAVVCEDCGHVPVPQGVFAEAHLGVLLELPGVHDRLCHLRGCDQRSSVQSSCSFLVIGGRETTVYGLHFTLVSQRIFWNETGSC